MSRDLIDIPAVAAMLGGLNPEHVRSRVSKRPDFPRPFRIGSRVMYDRSEISEWIESQRQTPHRITQKTRHDNRRTA